MPLRTLILILLVSTFSLRICAQQRTLYIIGDNVNLRHDTTLAIKRSYQVGFGTKLHGEKISPNWYLTDMPFDGPIYVSSEYAVEASEFLIKAEEKENRNGKTKFELMLLYKENNQTEKANSLLFDILKNNSRELYMEEGHEMCVLLGPYSYKIMLGSATGTVDYNAKTTRALAEKVVEVIPDSIIRAIALTDQAICCIYDQNLKQAEEILFVIIEKYASDLFIPVPCDYDFEGKIYPEINLKNAFYLLFQRLDKAEQKSLLNNLQNLSLKCDSLKSKEIINDITSNLSEIKG